MPMVAANGINLYVEDLGTANGGTPVVLITGLGYDEQFWTISSVADDLAQSRRVILPCNRGAGRSDKPAGPYDTATMAADVIGALDALDIEKAVIVGHSLGGFIAQELTLANPDRVERLVLAGTSFGGPTSIPPTPEALAVFFLDRTMDPMELIRRGLATAVSPTFLETQPERVQKLIDYRLTTPVPPAAFQSQLMAGAAHLTESRISAISCPTLLLAGECDLVVPPGNVELLKQKLPHAESVVIADSGHLFPIEKPAETTAALNAFIA
jgi:pimeloyl-ACP methyl ester carboxylesterase